MLGKDDADADVDYAAAADDDDDDDVTDDDDDDGYTMVMTRMR